MTKFRSSRRPVIPIARKKVPNFDNLYFEVEFELEDEEAPTQTAQILNFKRSKKHGS